MEILELIANFVFCILNQMKMIYLQKTAANLVQILLNLLLLLNNKLIKVHQNF